MRGLMVSRRVYEQAMSQCLRPWYTDDCKECREEFIKCLREYLTQLN